MITRSKNSYYRELQDIIDVVDRQEAKRQKEVDEAAFRGHLLSDKRKEQHRQERLRDLRTAKERLSKLKEDYKTFVEAENRPYSVEDVTLGVDTKKTVIGLRGADLDFLRSLQYVPLSKADYLYYGLIFRNDDNRLMCLALQNIAEKNGYKITGLVEDPEKDLQTMANAIKMAENILDADHLDDYTVEFAREGLQQYIEDSYPYDSDGKVKRSALTIEKADYDLTENPGTLTTATAPKGEDLKEEAAFVGGLLGEEEATNMVEAKARASVARIRFEQKEASQSAQDAQKAEETSDVGAD